MNFTYPAFLYALSAVAIPIIIHLFNFRKFKTVYFSSIRFLKEVKEETQAKSKLKHLLVLLTRILSICFLVFAFAQPVIPAHNAKINSGDNAVSIFIDNSFSMDAINKNGTLLDEAKKRALEIIAAYKPTDRFQILTNGFEGKHQRLVNKEEFTELLDEVKINPASHSLSEIVLRQKDLLLQSGAKNKIAFIISDFQKSNINFAQLKNDTSITFNLIPIVTSEKSNVYIDTCWFETPIRQYKQSEKLHVRIKNNSEKALENNSIKLFINNVQKTPASFSIDKESETEVVLSFMSNQTGFQHCRVELNDYPVTFDDKFYFSFQVSKNIPLLCINASGTTENIYLNKLLGTDSLFVYTNVQENKLDYSSLSNNKLIILNELKNISTGLAQELKRFMDNGGSLIVFPNNAIDLISYNDFFSTVKVNSFERLDTTKTKVDKINLDHSIYNDVFDKKTMTTANLDLPVVSKHYVLSKATHTNEEYLLMLQNGDVFLSKYDVGKGKLYISSISLSSDFSNFVKHSVFVPTLYKIAIYSQTSQPLFYTIGKDETIECENILTAENVYHIKGVTTNFDVIPEHKTLNSKSEIEVHNQIINADNYILLADNTVVSALSFNFNRKESDLTCLSSDELVKETEKNNFTNIKVLKPNEQGLTSTIAEIEQGKKLWKLCIILALIFLAIEVLLLRFMK